MNDQQFQALINALNNISDSIDNLSYNLDSSTYHLSEGLSILASAYIKINDPEGWKEAEEEAEKEFEDDGDE